MPSSKEAIHPSGLKIYFNEDDHSYIDNNKNRYISATTIVADAFEKFDSINIAKKCANSKGIDYHILLDEWKMKGDLARNSGTRLHENNEFQILGKCELMHKSNDMLEEIRFRYAKKLIDKIKNSNYISIEPEKIIFSPKLLIAGSIDLLVKYKSKYIIFDYKILSKDLQKFGFNGKCGILPETKNIQDSNYWHYAIQLQIYENILKLENYIDNSLPVEKILLVWNGNKFKPERLPDIKEVLQLMNKYIKIK